MTTLFDALVEDPRRAKEIVAGLDARNPEHRRASLDAMAGVLDAFIVPAAALMATSDDPDHDADFDLAELTGAELSGLAVGLFEDECNRSLHNCFTTCTRGRAVTAQYPSITASSRLNLRVTCGTSAPFTTSQTARSGAMVRSRPRLTAPPDTNVLVAIRRSTVAPSSLSL